MCICSAFKCESFDEDVVSSIGFYLDSSFSCYGIINQAEVLNFELQILLHALFLYRLHLPLKV